MCGVGISWRRGLFRKRGKYFPLFIFSFFSTLPLIRYPFCYPIFYLVYFLNIYLLNMSCLNHFSVCYDDECSVHRFEKECVGWFPKEARENKRVEEEDAESDRQFYLYGRRCTPETYHNSIEVEDVGFQVPTLPKPERGVGWKKVYRWVIDNNGISVWQVRMLRFAGEWVEYGGRRIYFY